MFHRVSRSAALCSDIGTLKCRRFTLLNRVLHLILIAAFKQWLAALVQRCLNVKKICSVSALLWDGFLRDLKALL